MANDDWSSKPYAAWLESCIREMIQADPVAIAMAIVSEDGCVSTCYYDVSPNDRACIIDAMRDDARERWLIDNREMIKAVLEGGDEDGYQEDDSETVST